MSHSFSPVTIKDAALIAEAEPLKVSNVTKLFLSVLVFVGLAAIMMGFAGEDPKSTWASLHVQFTYWFLVAAGLTCFSAVLTICNAQWSRPIRRIFESASPFFLYSIFPLLFLSFGAEHLFAWVHEPAIGKEGWLTPSFVYSRDVVAALILWAVSRKLVRLSLSRDIGAVRGGLVDVSQAAKERWSDKSYDSLMEDWSSDYEDEIKETSELMNWLSPVIVIVYSLVMSLIAFDQIMSVDYHWYSTLFGAMFFMSGVYVAMAWASIGYYLLRQVHPLFKLKVERRTLHDLGKLMFGFGIFWAYMFWSHYLPIWYGNIPEETGWVIIRLRLEPWHSWAWSVFGCCFIIPFLLGLSRDVKQVPVLLCSTAIIVAMGIYGMLYLFFVPTLFPTEIPFGLKDLAIGAGFLGIFLLSSIRFLERYPLMPFGDFYWKKD